MQNNPQQHKALVSSHYKKRMNTTTPELTSERLETIAISILENLKGLPVYQAKLCLDNVKVYLESSLLVS